MGKGWYRVTHVREGMALLDEKCPEWPEMAAGKKFRMQFGTECILGTTFGSFTYGRNLLDIPWNDTEKYGFNIFYPGIEPDLADMPMEDSRSPKWRRLGSTWEKMVAERVCKWPREEVK